MKVDPDRELTWIIFLNAIPLVGVVAFGWHTFELVLLYWFENVVIGIFTLLKFVVRRYEHRIELFIPLFFAPFFAMHYGGFTAGHGMFIFALFGETQTGDPIGELLLGDGLLWVLVALMALFVLHAQDWSRDVARRGLGADGVLTLMMAPYRRIIVLHLTILGYGFAMLALGEPMVGILLLVGLKTAFDIHQLRKQDGHGDALLSGRRLAFIEAAVNERRFTINSKEYQFETFRDMVTSPQFEFAMGFLRMLVSREEFAAANDILARKLADEGAAERADAAEPVAT